MNFKNIFKGAFVASLGWMFARFMISITPVLGLLFVGLLMYGSGFILKIMGY